MPVTRLLVIVLLLAACAHVAPAAPPQLAPGTYRLVAVNGKGPRVESPSSLGVWLESGTLDVEPDGRYVRFFLVRPLHSPDVATWLERGTYRLDAGSLTLTTDDRPVGPLRFTVEIVDNGLLLRDADGNAWVYRLVGSALG